MTNGVLAMSKSRANFEKKQIDLNLESMESRKIADAVKLLPQDELSMAWRSQLNAKLSEAARKKQRRLSFRRPLGWVAGLGLTAAASLALVFALLPNKTHQNGIYAADNLEAQMLVAHNLSVQSSDIAGEGLSSLDESESLPADTESDWRQEDLEPL